MNHRLILLVITEKQEKAILPHIQGAVADARDIDLEFIDLNNLRRKTFVMSLAIWQWIKNKRAAPLKDSSP